MTKLNLLKATFVAAVLVLGSSALKSNLYASGYIIASSITGEVECQKGGGEDCPTNIAS